MMIFKSAIRPGAQVTRETGKGEDAPPSAVLCFTAPIKAGKTTVSKKVAQSLVVPRVSFGEYLRSIARERGLELTREVLQDLGDKLVSYDVRGFCEEVLKQQPWEPRKPLIIDGVRHVEVLDLLSEILSPAKIYVIYIKVDRKTQSERLKNDSLPHSKMLDELENHATEQQVKSKLPDRATLVLDGTQNPNELTRKIVEFLTSRGDNPGQDLG